MNARRYLAILPRSENDAAFWRAKADHLDTPPILDTSDLIVFGNLIAMPIGLPQRGVIVGELIANTDRVPLRTLTDPQERAIAAGGIEQLLDHYWGSYVAFFRDGAGVSVLRSPLGELPGYCWLSPRGMVVASDVEQLIRVGGYAPTIDWVGIAEQLVAPDLRRPRTCLQGIEELQGGSQAVWKDGNWRVIRRWSPWDSVPARPRKITPFESGAFLEPIVRRAVEARSASAKRPLILLSGGLDSSIVAACLCDTARPVRALTMVTRDAGGDERMFAADAADRLGMTLTAVTRKVPDVDVRLSLSQGLPRPAEQSFAQATHAAIRALNGDFDAVFHGGGGDNLFCSLQSPAPAADRFLAAGPDRRFWATASGIATLAQVSVLRVVQKAIQRAATRRRAYRARGDHSLLSDHAIEAAAEALDHPWLTANERGLPGLAAHIGLIVAAQSVAESANMCAAPLWKSSLISQPIVEACVSLPSWVWYDRGCNRAAARHAFANALPAQVAWRRSKGAMSSFIVELFEANRPILYDLLIDGALANHGMIDRNAVAAILRNPSVTRGEAYGRVMRLADVETWIRSWRG